MRFGEDVTQPGEHVGPSRRRIRVLTGTEAAALILAQLAWSLKGGGGETPTPLQYILKPLNAQVDLTLHSFERN
jgi:hypothetical protein